MTDVDADYESKPTRLLVVAASQKADIDGFDIALLHTRDDLLAYLSDSFEAPDTVEVDTPDPDPATGGVDVHDGATDEPPVRDISDEPADDAGLDQLAAWHAEGHPTFSKAHRVALEKLFYRLADYDMTMSRSSGCPPLSFADYVVETERHPAGGRIYAVQHVSMDGRRVGKVIVVGQKGSTAQHSITFGHVKARHVNR